MAVVLAGRDLQIEEKGKVATVGSGCVPRMMYYLSCVANMISFTIPPRLRDYGRERSISDEDLLLLFGLAATLSPDVLMEAGIFIFDSEGICVRTGNRFFDIKDRQVAAIATEQVVIAGERVRVTEVMFFTRAWLQSNYLRPLGQLVDMVNAVRERPSRPAITYTPSPSPTPSYRSTYTPSYTPTPTPTYRPSYTPRETPKSSSTHQLGICGRWLCPLWKAPKSYWKATRRLWWVMVLLSLATMTALIYYLYDRHYPRIYSREIVMGIGMMCMVHGPVQFIRLHHSGRGNGFLTTLLMLAALAFTSYGLYVVKSYEKWYFDGAMCFFFEQLTVGAALIWFRWCTDKTDHW
jgi:hypothetical protein